MKCFLCFKSFYNNHNDPMESVECNDLGFAKKEAKRLYSYNVQYIGNNNYVANGTKTWVENEKGECIFSGEDELPLGVGDKVKIVGDPNMVARYNVFAPFRGTITTITNIAWADAEKTAVHQYGVKLGKGNAYFFPTELQII